MAIMRSQLENERGNNFYPTRVWTVVPWNRKPFYFEWSMLSVISNWFDLTFQICIFYVWPVEHRSWKSDLKFPLTGFHSQNSLKKFAPKNVQKLTFNVHLFLDNIEFPSPRKWKGNWNLKLVNGWWPALARLELLTSPYSYTRPHRYLGPLKFSFIYLFSPRISKNFIPNFKSHSFH